MADDDGEGENARAHSDDEEGEDDGEEEDGDAAGGDSEQAIGNEDGEEGDGNDNGAHGGEVWELPILSHISTLSWGRRECDIRLRPRENKDRFVKFSGFCCKGGRVKPVSEYVPHISFTSIREMFEGIG